MIDKIDQAIRAINPNAKYTMTNGIENIEWLEGTAPISVSDINSKIDELVEEYYAVPEGDEEEAF